MIKGGYQIVDLSKYEFKNIEPSGATIAGDFSDILSAIKTCNKPILFSAPKVEKSDLITGQGFAYPHHRQFSGWIGVGTDVLFCFHDESDVTHNNVVFIKIKSNQLELSFDPVI